MEKLLQMRALLLVLVFAWVTAAAGAEGSYCSLSVHVVSPDGRTLEFARVRVEERNGRTVEKVQRGGPANFCDLGILPVTVTVGLEGACNQTIVRNVPLEWGEPYLLKITGDQKPCLREGPPPPVPLCEVLFRVADSDENWVSGATIDVRAPSATLLTTDASGRAHFIVKRGTEVSGTIRAAGHRAARFDLPCTSGNETLEKRITLEEARAAK